jgi:hypothetical protein
MAFYQRRTSTGGAVAMVTITPDTKALAAKRKEIESLIAEFATRVSPELFDSFIEITAPEIEITIAPSDTDSPPSDQSTFVRATIGPYGVVRGKTRKLGNIRFNWRRLFELGPDVMIAAAPAVDSRWFIPAAGLYILNKLRQAVSVALHQTEAIVLCSLWSNHQKDKISEQSAFVELQSYTVGHRLAQIDKSTFDECITRLHALGCIEMDSGNIGLREQVEITYE